MRAESAIGKTNQKKRTDVTAPNEQVQGSIRFEMQGKKACVNRYLFLWRETDRQNFERTGF